MRTLRQIERAPAPGAPRLAPDPRELQVIAAIVKVRAQDIGKQFGLSEQTVKNHLSNIFDKRAFESPRTGAVCRPHHCWPAASQRRTREVALRTSDTPSVQY